MKSHNSMTPCAVVDGESFCLGEPFVIEEPLIVVAGSTCDFSPWRIYGRKFQVTFLWVIKKRGMDGLSPSIHRSAKPLSAYSSSSSWVLKAAAALTTSSAILPVMGA